MNNISQANSKCLWVKGKCGLGNRLLSLEIACRYASKYGLAVHVDWRDPIYRQSHEQFLELFDLAGISDMTQPEISAYRSMYPQDANLFLEPDFTKLISSKKLMPNLNPQLAPWRKYGRYINCFRYKHSMKYAVRNGEFLDKYAQTNDLLMFCCDLPMNEPEHFRHVKMRPGVVSKIFAQTNLARITNDIAIHIRNTDKSANNIECSVDAIRAVMDSNQSIRTLHLATDSKIVQDYIYKELDTELEIQTLNIDRSEDPIHLEEKHHQAKRHDLQLALLDIYILSKSSHLLFQGNSSFGRVAVAMQDYGLHCKDWTNS
jgi:hypothetical protein